MMRAPGPLSYFSYTLRNEAITAPFLLPLHIVPGAVRQLVHPQRNEHQSWRASAAACWSLRTRSKPHLCHLAHHM